MNTVTEQSLYSLRATSEDCADAGEDDRAALLRACETTLSEALNHRDTGLERMRTRIESLRGLCKSASGWLHDAGDAENAERVLELVGDMELPLTPNV